MKFQLLLTAFAATVSTTTMANEFVNKPSSLDIPIATLNQAGFTAEGLKRIDTFFASEIEKKRVPGGVVGIVRDGKLVYLKAHGTQNPETQEPMKVDTIFALASMTKPMVSVGTLTLTQQAKLPLFSKVSDYYPDVANMKVAIKKSDGSTDYENVKNPMTVQDLMRHTSGLTYGGRPDTSSPAAKLYPSGNDAANSNGTLDFMSKITKLPLVYQPGTIFEYSLSHDVLGSVVEKVSGKSLDAYLRESIWSPLKMNDTGFWVPSTKLSRLAKSQINPKTGKPFIGSPANSLPKLLNGGGGLISTASDYARFSQMMLNLGELEGARILSRKSIELMTSNHLPPAVSFTNVVNFRWGSTGPTPAAGMGFGLGFAVRLENGRSTLPGSTGELWWLGSTGTNFVIDPKEKLILILLTQQPDRLSDYLNLMRQMGYAMLVD